MAIPWKPELEAIVRNIEVKNVGQGHRYAVPGELKTLVSVTTRLNIKAKGFGFNRWLRRDSLNYMEELLLTTEPQGDETYPEYLARLKQLAENPPQDKRDLGSMTHAYIERYITGIMPDVGFEYDAEFEGMAIASAEVAVQHIENLALDHDTIESEIKVFSPEYDYAGTIDLIGYSLSAKAWLVVDWKRAKGLWPENAYQVSAYASAFKELVAEGTPVQAWVCLLPSEEGVQIDRKQADIDFGTLAFLELMQADETNREAEKLAWR